MRPSGPTSLALRLSLDIPLPNNRYEQHAVTVAIERCACSSSAGLGLRHVPEISREATFVDAGYRYTDYLIPDGANNTSHVQGGQPTLLFISSHGEASSKCAVLV